MVAQVVTGLPGLRDGSPEGVVLGALHLEELVLLAQAGVGVQLPGHQIEQQVKQQQEPREYQRQQDIQPQQLPAVYKPVQLCAHIQVHRHKHGGQRPEHIPRARHGVRAQQFPGGVGRRVPAQRHQHPAQGEANHAPHRGQPIGCVPGEQQGVSNGGQAGQAGKGPAHAQEDAHGLPGRQGRQAAEGHGRRDQDRHNQIVGRPVHPPAQPAPQRAHQQQHRDGDERQRALFDPQALRSCQEAGESAGEQNGQLQNRPPDHVQGPLSI